MVQQLGSREQMSASRPAIRNSTRSEAVEPDAIAAIEGSGPNLILVHGIGATRSIWSTLVPTLSQYFTVVRYDLRGHGSHPTRDPHFGLEELVDDLEWIRGQLGLNQVHLAGHSLGGMIVPAYARKYPGHVLSMSLFSTAAGRTEQDSANVWNVVRAMEQQSVAGVLPTLVDRWFTDEFTSAHPDIVAARLQQVLSTDEAVFMNVFRIYAATEMLPWLHEIEAPALVLTGENDGGCSPRLNRLIATRLHTSSLVILPRYKHSILLEAGPEIAGCVLQFISKIDARIQLSAELL